MQFMIHCSIEGSLDGAIYSIWIKDEQDKCIYKSKTNNNGILNVTLPDGIYKIYARSCLGTLCKVVFVNDKLCPCIPFLFKAVSTPTITFIVTDQHYKDLPIKEGVITLWHNT